MDKLIKDMLVNGEKTPDELRELLEREITEAQKEIEKKEADSTETRRNDLALSLIRYGEVLGLDFDIEVEEAAAMLKEVEPELRKYAKILKILLEDVEEKEDKEEVEPRIFKPTSLTKFAKDSVKEGTLSVEIDKKMDELVEKVMKGLI